MPRSLRRKSSSVSDLQATLTQPPMPVGRIKVVSDPGAKQMPVAMAAHRTRDFCISFSMSLLQLTDF